VVRRLLLVPRPRTPRVVRDQLVLATTPPIQRLFINGRGGSRSPPLRLNRRRGSRPPPLRLNQRRNNRPPPRAVDLQVRINGPAPLVTMRRFLLTPPRLRRRLGTLLLPAPPPTPTPLVLLGRWPIGPDDLRAPGTFPMVVRLIDIVGEVPEPLVAPSNRSHAVIRRVEVSPQLRPVEIDVVELAAGQIGPGGVDRNEVGVVEPAGPRRIERTLRPASLPAPAGPALPALGQLIDGRLRIRRPPPGGDDGIRLVALLVVTFLHDRGVRHQGVLVVLLFPVLVVLEAHATAPRTSTWSKTSAERPGECSSPRRRIVPPSLTHVPYASGCPLRAVDVEG
jgi:hypothetical protein